MGGANGFVVRAAGRDGGSGLGLTLAQTFVSQHHGTIEVETGPGRTCFTVLLPVEGPRSDATDSN